MLNIKPKVIKIVTTIVGHFKFVKKTQQNLNSIIWSTRQNDQTQIIKYPNLLT